MGVTQKAMFSISDRLAKFFGISGAPMEHNAIAKSKQTFCYKLGINSPGLLWRTTVDRYKELYRKKERGRQIKREGYR